MIFGLTAQPSKHSIVPWMMIIAIVLATWTLFQSPVHAGTSYTVHSPIVIVGDSQFTAANGVTGGTGKRSDPFLISGWSIVAPNGQAAIRIESTTSFFQIIHVQLLRAQPGIYLTDVANGLIENSTLMNSSFGIQIESSTNILIAGNNVSGQSDGVYSVDILSAPQTTRLTIVNNTFSGAGAAVYSSQSAASLLNVTSNSFLSSALDTSAYGAIVARNNFTGGPSASGERLTVEGNNSIVTNNLVSSGDIQIWGSGTTVKNNRADRISLNAATSISLVDNVINRAVVIPTFQPFDTPPYYDSHFMTGNTVNGKPLIYLAKCTASSIDGTDIGEVILASCTGARVANLRLSGGEEGIMFVYVSQGSIVGNNLSGNILRGIEILHSSNLQVSNNDLNGTGTSISDTDNVTFTGNLGLGGNSARVTIDRGNGILVAHNTLRGTALSIADVINATVAENWISDTGGGIYVDGANGLNITANNIVRTASGLTLNLGTLNGIFNGKIYHNNFVDNAHYQAAYYPYLVTAFDNGYPSGGNYWSDYKGADNCSGPQQSICTGPDGIGDKPYTGIFGISTSASGYQNPGTLIDRYPLTKPYGNFSWDAAAPTWPTGSALTLSIVNSTSLKLAWTAALDDAWVSGYRVYQDNTLVASTPRYVQNYTVTDLVPGSAHTFRVEAGDPGLKWSVDGPSVTASLPQGSNPPAATLLVSTMSWLMQHWYLGLLAGGSLGIVVASILVIQKKRPRA